MNLLIIRKNFTTIKTLRTTALWKLYRTDSYFYGFQTFYFVFTFKLFCKKTLLICHSLFLVTFINLLKATFCDPTALKNPLKIKKHKFTISKNCFFFFSKKKFNFSLSFWMFSIAVIRKNCIFFAKTHRDLRLYKKKEFRY